MVEILCPHCEDEIALDDDASGIFACPHCDGEFEWNLEPTTAPILQAHASQAPAPHAPAPQPGSTAFGKVMFSLLILFQGMSIFIGVVLVGAALVILYGLYWLFGQPVPI